MTSSLPRIRYLFAALGFCFNLACGHEASEGPGDGGPGADAAKPGADGGDASPSGDDGAPSECHGYCPKPNGASCYSDCDCENKCLGGGDKTGTCGDELAPTVNCDDAGACPDGSTCGTFGICAGTACGSNDDCPAKENCIDHKCVVFGCI